MTRRPPTRPMIATLFALVAGLFLMAQGRAQDAITQANNQDGYWAGVAPLHTDEVATDGLGNSYVNNAAGTRFVIGYESTRTRTIFGLPGWYTDLDVAVGAASVRYDGIALVPSNGTQSSINQAATYLEEGVRLRLGRSQPLLSSKAIVLTPFLGVSQKSWTRDALATGSATFYTHVGAQAGLLLQVNLPYHWVLGAEAAGGRILGATEFDGYGSRNLAGSSAFALSLDHRTYAEWHQRLQVRQNFLRYGSVNGAGGGLGLYEPRRSSDLAILLFMGTETGSY